MNEVPLVKEGDLDFGCFSCCGDEDLYPFRCSKCGHIMVFCYECETLYPDLLKRRPNPDRSATNHFDPTLPAFACPRCSFEFEYFFMKNPDYFVPVQDWLSAGLGHLLGRS